MTENLRACYGVRKGAREPVKNLFSLLTRSSVDEDIRSVISWGGDNASFIVHNFTKFHKLVGELYRETKTDWLKSFHDFGFYRENERARTFSHRQGLLQRERSELLSEIRYCGQPGKKRVKA